MHGQYRPSRLPLQEQAWQKNQHRIRHGSSSHHNSSWNYPEHEEAPKSQWGQSYNDRDADHWHHKSRDEVPAGEPAEDPRQQRRLLAPYEDTSFARREKRIDDAARLVASDVYCEDWDETYIRRWRKLLNDVPHMESAEEKEKAINILIDCFHRLNLVNDQENLIDIIYDYCEPDVDLEGRKLGCQFLVRLSNNSTPKIIKRNVDVLCQLISIILESSDHLPVISAREKADQWEGCCLEFFQNCIKDRMADYVESEIELCQQSVQMLRELVKLQKLQPSDVDFALALVAPLRFDFSKLPPDSSGDDLKEETCRHLRTLNVFAVDFLMGLPKGESAKKSLISSSDDDGSLLCAAKTTDHHNLLRQIHALHRVNIKHGIVGISSIDLLSFSPPRPSSEAADETAMSISSPLVCYLPDKVLLKILRHLCNAATKTSPATTHDKETRQLKQNIIAAIVKLFPTVEVSKEAQHASNGVQMQVAEALLIACTIFWPLQRKSRTEDLEIDAVQTRLRSLYAMSQAFTSKASEEKERKRAEPSIEVVQEWEEQLCAAHNAHRIAKEYLRPADRRDVLYVTADWLEKREDQAEAVTVPETTTSAKRPAPEALPMLEPRGRGIKMAPIPGSSTYTHVSHPQHDQQHIQDRYRTQRPPFHSQTNPFHHPRGGYGRHHRVALPFQAQGWDQRQYSYGRARQ